MTQRSVNLGLGTAVLWLLAGAAFAQNSSDTPEHIPDSQNPLQFLGPAREISHSDSASRDTAVLGITVYPRVIHQAGGDFSLVSYNTGDVTARLGAFAMLELFGNDRTDEPLPFPSGGIELWRGLWGYSVAFSLDAFARELCGKRCALEGAVSMRHESEHYTGSNEGDSANQYRGFPHIGNFIMPDIALRYPIGRWDLVIRTQHKIWISRYEETPYRYGPGGDLIVRWRRWEYVHPFSSLFAEYYFAKDAPSPYFVRNLTGIIIPSRYGDTYLFLTGDVGHGKGFMVNREEASLGCGLKFAFF